MKKFLANLKEWWIAPYGRCKHNSIIKKLSLYCCKEGLEEAMALLAKEKNKEREARIEETKEAILRAKQEIDRLNNL